MENICFILGWKGWLSLFIMCLNTYTFFMDKKLCWRSFGWIGLVYQCLALMTVHLLKMFFGGRMLSSFFAFFFKFVWLLIALIFTSSVFVYVLAPFQQPPPTGEVLNSSVINLSWSSPDSPNSNRLIYQLYRGEEEIYTTEDYHPYSK